MMLFPESLTLLLAVVPGVAPAVTAWMQGYDPAHRWWLSTLWAALPLLVLLAAMIGLRLKGHISALIALALALVITVGIFHMPVHLAALSTCSTLDLQTLHVPLTPLNFLDSIARARLNRERTVPTGQSSATAASS